MLKRDGEAELAVAVSCMLAISGSVLPVVQFRIPCTDKLDSRNIHFCDCPVLWKPWEFREKLFLHVRYSPEIRESDKVMGRLDNFLAKYGFARNLGFTSLVVGMTMLADFHLTEGSNPELVQYGVTALVAGVLLINRYLKFFRQYSYEMFNTYAKEEADDGRA
jgi:hypothetical protein